MIVVILFLIAVGGGFLAGGTFMAIANYHNEQEMDAQLRAVRNRQTSVTLEVWVHESETLKPWGRFLDGADVDIHSAVRALALTHQGQAFSENGMAGILSRNDFRTLRDWLIAGKFAAWRDPHAHTQGIDFTNTGLALLRSAYDYLTPTPPLQSVHTHTQGGHSARMRTHARLRTT